MKTVVLAEKPDQKRKLQQAYQAGSFPELGEVTFVNARGHLYELDEPEIYTEKWDRKNPDGTWKTVDQSLAALPIFPEEFKYHKKAGVSSLISEIQKAIMAADQVLIATDPDAEGASIAWKIIWRTKGYENKVIKQLAYNAQTLDDFQKAFAAPVSVDRYKPMAHQAITREQSDWLVGMNASRLVTNLLRKQGYMANFPVGRVQTPTVAKIVQREREIQNYNPKENLRVTLKDMDYEITFKGVDGIGEFRPSDGGSSAAQSFYTQLAAGQSVVVNVETAKEKQAAPMLFKFSKLQAEASRKFKWTPKKTSEIYQKLYEHGWVSYPRTDEQHIAPSEFSYLAENITTLLALVGLSGMPLAYLSPRAKYVKEKGLDHSANIPSSQIPTSEQLSSWSDEEQALYKMIVERTVLMFAPDMLYDETVVTVKNSEHLFNAKGKVITDPGWTTYTANEKSDKVLPQYTTGAIVSLVPQMDNIAAPKRYTETDMTDHVMDAMGLGRPSTQAATIEKIETTYVNREGKRGELSPKPEAFILIDFLEDTMLTSAELTANWEKYLDQIGEGRPAAKPEVFLNTLKQFLEKLRDDLPKRAGDKFGNITPEQLREAHKPYQEISNQITTPFGTYELVYREGKTKAGSKYSNATLFDGEKKEVAVVWGTQYGKQLTERQLTKLLEQGQINQLTFKKKSGDGTYKANLILQSDFSVKMDFSK